VAIDTPSRIAFLKKIHLFYGLKDADFATLAEELDERNVAKGEVIFAQDSKADAFYLIYAGNVRIARKVDRKETQLALLVKNDYFGEMALVANRKRSATVTATSDGTLLILPRAHFDKLYKRSPQLKANLEIAVKSRLLARRLKFKWLRPDEVVYFLTRKHPFILWQTIALPVLAMVFPLGFLYLWLLDLSAVLYGALGIVLAVIGALYIAWLVVDWGNDYYIVTNQRVVWLEKVVGIYDSRQEAPIGTILSVGVESNQVGQYLDYGNVIVRTFVGKIPFNNINHPDHASKMIEEYWNRTKENAATLEKEALKNALRKRLGLPLPKMPPAFGEVSAQPKQAPPPPKSGLMGWLIKRIGSNTLKLRYESGDSVIYRKHWVVLIFDGWMPFLGSLVTLLLLLFRFTQLSFLPDKVLISWADTFVVDTWTMVFFVAFFPFAGWFAYKVADWSNDKYEVTNEQIIDIDRTPLGADIRNAAPLEGIMSTMYERKGLLGHIFNFGTVYITVGGTKMAFENVVDPATVQSDIDRRRMARNAKQNEAKVGAERERMADWLAAYHRAAEQLREEERRLQKKG
jgi:hypothetical protein